MQQKKTKSTSKNSISVPPERKHPKLIRTLIGHRSELSNLVIQYNARHLHHAYIVSGKPSIGKASFVYYFAKLVLANSSINGKINGTSLSNTEAALQTLSLIEENAHSNLLTVEPEKDPKTGSSKAHIGVDQVRIIKSFTNSTSLVAHNLPKIVVIDTLDQLNVNAANAILKVLEEPAPNRLFFLVCNNQANILPTIKSRCASLRLNNLTAEEVRQIIATWRLTEEHSNILSSLPNQRAIIDSLTWPLWFLDEGNLLAYQACKETIVNKDINSLNSAAEAAKKLTNDNFTKLVNFLLETHPLPEAAGATAFASKPLAIKKVLQENLIYNLDKSTLITSVLLSYLT